MEKIEQHIPFIGALLKTEQDVDALQRYMMPRAASIGRVGPTWGRGIINDSRQQSAVSFQPEPCPADS